jgi:endonuclease III
MIGDSIANDPSKFALYAEDDDLDKIIKSIGWPEDKVKSLLRYSNIRNQI